MQRLVDRQRVELRLELRLVRLGAAEAHRALADGLDPLARARAHLLGDHVAEEPPEKPPVLA